VSRSRSQRLIITEKYIELGRDGITGKRNLLIADQPLEAVVEEAALNGM
jgi:hypothetical protein